LRMYGDDFGKYPPCIFANRSDKEHRTVEGLAA
jgi:hypothetical protein